MKFCIFTDPHLAAYPEKLKEFKAFIQKVEAEVDGFICAGDWASVDFREIETDFFVLREATQKPVLTVFGNHCHWVRESGRSSISLDEIFSYHRDVSKKYNITYLEEEYFETDSLFIGGFNGWYNKEDATLTKDYLFIPSQNSYGGTSFQVLKKKESDALFKLLDKADTITNKKKICVTHFGFISDPGFEGYRANPRHYEAFIKEKFDVLIFGHSHRKIEVQDEKCLVINAGADYLEDVGIHYIIKEF